MIKNILVMASEVLLPENLEPQQQTVCLAHNPETKMLIEHAINVWKLEKSLTNMFDLNNKANRKVNSALTGVKQYLENFKVEVIDYAGQKFVDGMNVDVLSFEMANTGAEPTILETFSPEVRVDGMIATKAKVIVSKNENQD